MKEILVSQPEYVQNFRCIGSACEDHCCKQWDITLDKNTYKKYLKSEIPDVRNIAVENIAVTKNSFGSWAMMKFNEQGNCSFLESNNLCKIHRTMGAEALGNICASYPRYNVVYKKESIESLSISCPEAVRQVLFNETALNIDTQTITQATFYDRADLNIEGKIVNLFCANLLMENQNRVEQNLYSIACFLLYAQKLSGALDSKFGDMENVYSALVQQMQSGKTPQAMASITGEPLMELAIIYGIRGAFESHHNARGSTTLAQYTQKLNQHFTGDLSEQQRSDNLDALKQAWGNIALPWLNERPHILRNYFQYRLYHDRFGIDKSVPLLKQLYLLVVDYFYIKSLLSADILHKGELSERAITDVIYSYHALRHHSEMAKAQFLAGIDSIKRNDDLSVLQLLV